MSGIKHPTHIATTCTKDKKPNDDRSIYLERNEKNNWVEFRTSPGEWNGETGETLLQYDIWDYYLIDIREVTQKELIDYWKQDQRKARRHLHDAEDEVKKAEEQLRRAKEQVEICNEWITWSAEHLKDAEKEK